MFEITQKGRAFIDQENRPRGGNAPWVRGPAFQPSRRAAAFPPLPRAA